MKLRGFAFIDLGERRYPRNGEQYLWLGEPQLVHCHLEEEACGKWADLADSYVILHRLTLA